MRVLVVEDDAAMRDFIASELGTGGYTVTVAENGREGLMQAATADFDVLIVDRMLPLLDGIGMLRALRSIDIMTPVILLTALGQIDDRVSGLRAGADDYLVKPFAIEELAARINAVNRRCGFKQKNETLKVGDLALDRLTHTAYRGGQNITLKPREFRLLEYLMLNAPKVVTRTMLLEAVWDYHFDPQTTLVESHISRIRAKVDRGFAQELIHTVYGSGYRISDERET